MYGYRKYPYPPQRLSLEIQGGGVSKAKMFKGKYEAKLEIPGVGCGGFQTKKTMDIFWNHTIQQN